MEDLNLSMRPELPGMICFFSFCFFRKARAKWRDQGDNATWRSVHVHVQVEDNLPGLRNHGAPNYCHAIIDIGRPKPINIYNFINHQEKKNPPFDVLPSHLLFIFPHKSSLSRLIKPFSNRLNHTREPVQIQETQQRRASQIRERQPGRHGKFFPWGMQCKPDVLIHFDGLVGSPNKTAGPKSADKDDAVDELRNRPGHAEFVHEPVDVEERGRKFVKDEVEAVVVHKRPLEKIAGLVFFLYNEPV